MEIIMTLFKHLIIASFVLSALPLSAAAPAGIKDPEALIGNELSRLEDLIQATQLSLEAQKKLKGEIIDYQKVQEQFLASPKDNELLMKVVKSAHKTLRTIKDNHLENMFDADFINELTILSQPAAKRGVPKP